MDLGFFAVEKTDPNLFAIDWGQLSEALTAIIVLSFLVERALAVFFENRHVDPILDSKGVKDPIAFVVACIICFQYDFDILAVIMHQSKTGLLGIALTAATIAGGSKASIQLFHNVLGVKPTTKTPPPAKGGAGSPAGGPKPPAGGATN